MGFPLALPDPGHTSWQTSRKGSFLRRVLWPSPQRDEALRASFSLFSPPTLLRPQYFLTPSCPFLYQSLLYKKAIKDTHSLYTQVTFNSLQWASQLVLVVKNTPANAGDSEDAGLTPGSGRSPGGGNGNPPL